MPSCTGLTQLERVQNPLQTSISRISRSNEYEARSIQKPKANSRCRRVGVAFATLSIDKEMTKVREELKWKDDHKVVLTNTSANNKRKNNNSNVNQRSPRSVNNNNNNSINAVTSLPKIIPADKLNIAGILRELNDGAASFPANILNVADSLISSFLTPPHLNPTVDPTLQLSGSCSPVGETPPTVCSVIKGEIPKDLNGAYLRNGPNATYLHEGDGCHLFDGDGMLHSVLIDDGTATFCSRYVKTSRFRQEQAAGRPLLPKSFGGMTGLSGLARVAVTGLRVALGLVDVSEGTGLSNTSVGYFNGKVLSMSEDDMPYVVRVTDGGDLVTVGSLKLPHKANMCAHPKFDSVTGEMYAFSFNPAAAASPFTFFRVSGDGVKSADVGIPMGDMPLVHDFAITKRYVVVPESQLVVRPAEILKGQMAVTCDSDKTARFCVLPRYALPEDGIRQAQWFEAPGCNSMHYLNAWDDGPDEVVLITPVLSPVEKVLEFPAVNTTCTLSEVRLNTRTGRSSCRKICSGNLELGTVNQKYVGRKSRYGYLASGCFPELNGIVKVDLQAAVVVGRRDFVDSCYCGEPFFVPKSTGRAASEDVPVAEDDGYIVCYVHNQGTGISEFLVMDARSPSLDIIAAVQLPSRVPVGFHGYFVTKDQLAAQH